MLLNDQAMLKRNVTKPYSPIPEVNSAEANPKDGPGNWSPQQMPASVSSTFGSNPN